MLRFALQYLTNEVSSLAIKKYISPRYMLFHSFNRWMVS